MGLDAVVADVAPKPRTDPSNAPGEGLSASQFEFGGIRWWSGGELKAFDETEASGERGSFELELRSSTAVGGRQWRCDVRGRVANIGRLRTHEAYVEQGPTSD